MKENRPVIEVPIPQELNDVLDAIVRSFGIAKVEIIRRAIYSYLQEKEAISTAFTYDRAPTRTHGRLGHNHHERKQ